MVRQVSCAPKSWRGRKTWPTAIIRWVSGSWPVRRIWSWKNCTGICTWMPAPSPVLPSASTAPRCQTALSASIPFCTTCREGLPSTETTSPTPQLAFSSSGLYRPFSATQSRLACSLAAQLASNLVMVSLLVSRQGGRGVGCLSVRRQRRHHDAAAVFRIDGKKARLAGKDELDGASVDLETVIGGGIFADARQEDAPVGV